MQPYEATKRYRCPGCHRRHRARHGPRRGRAARRARPPPPLAPRLLGAPPPPPRNPPQSASPPLQHAHSGATRSAAKPARFRRPPSSTSTCPAQHGGHVEADLPDVRRRPGPATPRPGGAAGPAWSPSTASTASRSAGGAGLDLAEHDEPVAAGHEVELAGAAAPVAGQHR